SSTVILTELRRHKVIASSALVLLLLLIGAGIIGLYKIVGEKKPVIDTHNMKIAAITDNGAVDDYVAISPDGKLVAYGLLEKPYKMVVKQLATGTEVKVLEGSDSLYSGAVFSPDGNFLYYRHRSGATFDLYSVPSLGGISRRVAVDVGSAVSFSPGGK